MEKMLVCIQCPQGCKLTVSHSGEGVSVTGNKCPRGASYAQQEVINPCRTLTTTVRTAFVDFPLLPVRTLGEIPLKSVFGAMGEISRLVVKKRLRPGDVVLEKLYNTDVALIATDDMTMGEKYAKGSEDYGRDGILS